MWWWKLRICCNIKVKGVCIFKECVSLPGVSNIVMHRPIHKCGSYCPYFDKSMSDLEQLSQKNVQESLSVIQHRYENIGKTHIRNYPEKVCKWFIGLDANSLYWYALSREFCTGPFLRQYYANSFKTSKTI